MKLTDAIKKDAIKTGAKIQASDAAQLEKILNKTFYLERNLDKELEFLKHVMTRGQKTTERKGLHASAIIVSDKKFCLRQQVLSLLYHQLQGEQINVSLKRIFEEGNAIHEKWQRLFVRANFSEPTELDKTMESKRYQLSYTPDIICKIPEFYNGLMIGEIKSANTFQFKKMERHPSAYKQLQLYMYLSGIEKGFVLCEDKNTQDFKVEVYDFDINIVDPFINRLKQIKQGYDNVFAKHKMVKRPSDAVNATCKRCVGCPMHIACWTPSQAVRL